MKFSIRFGDNDFGSTALGFGRLFLDHEYSRDFKEGWLTKQRIVELWNDSIHTLYKIVQNRGRYAGLPEGSKYLTINKSCVKLNEEVLDTKWDNGETLVVDLNGMVFLV